VGHIEKARLRGLDGIRYLDKTDRNQAKTQQGEVVIVSETDRVYLNTLGAVQLEDAVLDRSTRVEKQHSRTTVVWNPWIDKARALSDLGDDEWVRMICIETSNVSDFAVDLEPGRQHIMKATVSITDR
jgi:glucose-6-phosphate 1-epimerase